MSPVYEIENLTKIYRGSERRANDGLTFDIRAGEIFGLLGPNGAGKSTLVNQLAGLLRPTSGAVRLFGQDVVRRAELVAEYVALQPQHSGALQDLYPEEAILHTARFRGLGVKEARRQTDDLMAELGLDGVRRRQIRSLSGGQRKLVTLAVAFVGDRPVQIFDEPTNELDPEVRRMVWQKLLRQNQRGATIILVTHNVLEAERVIQRVGIINHGRLMALGTPGELKARVDQRVRLDLLFKAEANGHAALLEELGEAHPLSRQHWTVLCRRDTVRASIDQVLARIGLEQLDDFRILTPSLEDVYLQLGGGTTLG
ncbi:MAG TPA: ABC transporter ATP-binding protein [Roseiflexaceae bacterium]|nr:ABC transporter ATP-binding protein [Roseiflexaceae bacterium]